MLVMTYSDARTHLARLLDAVKVDGAAMVKRADGTLFRITVEDSERSSPLSCARPVLGRVGREEVIGAIRESRAYAAVGENPPANGQECLLAARLPNSPANR